VYDADGMGRTGPRVLQYKEKGKVGYYFGDPGVVYDESSYTLITEDIIHKCIPVDSDYFESYRRKREDCIIGLYHIDENIKEDEFSEEDLNIEENVKVDDKNLYTDDLNDNNPFHFL